MVINTDFFELASLAEASYVNITDYTQSGIKTALMAENFSDTQAEVLLANWKFITDGHQPNTSSGFSSTLFQNKDDDSYALAFRGTEASVQWGTDIGTDVGDIVSDGLAIDQIIDLYNEWRRITSTGTYMAATTTVLAAETAALSAAWVNPAQRAVQLASLALRNDVIVDIQSRTLLGGVTISFPVVKTITFESSNILFSNEPSRQQGLGLAADIASNGLTITGHSLGGHLAAAFTRLFPQSGASALTINGAGFGNFGFTGVSAVNIKNLFSLLGGAP